MSTIPYYTVGGAGPIVLFLHANGLHGHMLQFMAKHFAPCFSCVLFDLPGHGASTWKGPQADTKPEDLAELVYNRIVELGLKGCYCFGHSLGGGMAMMTEFHHPGTFSAIYVFEPAVCVPKRHQLLLERPEEFPSPHLEVMARRRRSQFASHEAALHYLSSRPMFSSLQPDVLAAFVQHGFRPIADEAVAGPSQSTDSGAVVLCCDPEIEARIFELMEPLPSRDWGQIKCPVAVGLGANVPGPHSRLVNFGEELKSLLGKEPAASRRFPTLTHMGPIEDPQLLAQDVLQFIEGVQINRSSRMKDAA